jgi:hypothetical protein
MGGSSVDANVLGVRFADDTYQTTAGVPSTDAYGNSYVTNADGITITDAFGNSIETGNDFIDFGGANSGGGFGQFFDGTEWNASISDGNGNSLLLGLGFGSNFNLSNENTSSGIINPSGALTNIYGTPVNIIGSLEVNGVPIGGGTVVKSQRVHVGVIASATPSAITTLTWTSPFVDNNYTVTASVTIAETPPNGAATEIITVGSMQLSASGVGLTFVVCNASSGVHDVTVNFLAVHD